MCWKLNPAETIIAGKKKYNESKNVLELHDDECKELRNSTDEELREKLRESKIIAAGQQFDCEIASRSTMYSAIALVVSIMTFLLTSSKHIKDKEGIILFFAGFESVAIIVLVIVGMFFINNSVRHSHLREYHNFRAMCIEDILEEREKGRLSIAQNGGRTYVVTLSENTAP